jgi:hypothetical protein
MIKLPLTAAFTILCSIASAAPRSDVDGVAAVIEANFFDAQRAVQIANDLRRSAAAGELDRYAQRVDLANELTQRLRKIDGHFSVRWSSNASQKQDPRATRATPLPASRTNYGFRRVERLSGNIGYIDLAYAADIDFSRPDDPSRRAADAALALMRDADAVIIDLRSNGGGAPSMVGYLVSAFVDAKANVYNTFHSRAGVDSERPAITYAAPMLSVPVFVLTSGRTGSAAESIAFTLQSAKRAQVVGERSGGAANPGVSFQTPEGYEVFIATGSPRNPINGRNWEGEGVKPDVEVSAERALVRARELALEKVLAGSIAGAARTDTQWALEALRAAGKPSTIAATADLAGSFGGYMLKVERGALYAVRARWPARTLLPLQKDLYYFEDDPSRRVAVHRENGAVVAISILSSDGGEQRLSRQP